MLWEECSNHNCDIKEKIKYWELKNEFHDREEWRKFYKENAA